MAQAVSSIASRSVAWSGNAQPTGPRRNCRPSAVTAAVSASAMRVPFNFGARNNAGNCSVNFMILAGPQFELVHEKRERFSSHASPGVLILSRLKLVIGQATRLGLG